MTRAFLDGAFWAALLVYVALCVWRDATK